MFIHPSLALLRLLLCFDRFMEPEEKKIKDEYDFIAMLDQNLGMVVNYGGQFNRFKIAN